MGRVTSAQYSSIAAAGAVTGAAVVVDVMRAFTTAAWALHLGVDRVVLAGDPDHALYLKRFFPGAVACADGPPRDGFELVNSPAKVAQHDLAGRVLVQCTTNGTAGVLAAWRAQPLYCASFVVARATARALAAAGPAAVTFVITGDGGHAEEDRACADYISALMDDPSTDAVSYCERASGAASAADLRRGVGARIRRRRRRRRRLLPRRRPVRLRAARRARARHDLDPSCSGAAFVTEFTDADESWRHGFEPRDLAGGLASGREPAGRTDHRCTGRRCRIAGDASTGSP